VSESPESIRRDRAPAISRNLAVVHLNVDGDTPSWLAISIKGESRTEVRLNASATVIYASLGLEAFDIQKSIAFNVAMWVFAARFDNHSEPRVKARWCYRVRGITGKIRVRAGCRNPLDR
jgi:hypothetical protein